MKLWVSEVTQTQKKSCCSYPGHQNPNTVLTLCNQCLATPESLLHFKGSIRSPGDVAWVHKNKFQLSTGKEIRGQSMDPFGKMEIQKLPEFVGGSKRKASFNTSPHITHCSVYHLSGLAAKGLSKTNNPGTQQFSRHFSHRAGQRRWAHPIEVPESHLPEQIPGDFVKWGSLHPNRMKTQTHHWLLHHFPITCNMPSQSSLPCFPLPFSCLHNPDSLCRQCTVCCLFFLHLVWAAWSKCTSSQRASPNSSWTCYRRAGCPSLL